MNPDQRECAIAPLDEERPGMNAMNVEVAPDDALLGRIDNIEPNDEDTWLISANREAFTCELSLNILWITLGLGLGINLYIMTRKFAFDDFSQRQPMPAWKIALASMIIPILISSFCCWSPCHLACIWCGLGKTNDKESRLCCMRAAVYSRAVLTCCCCNSCWPCAIPCLTCTLIQQSMMRMWCCSKNDETESKDDVEQPKEDDNVEMEDPERTCGQVFSFTFCMSGAFMCGALPAIVIACCLSSLSTLDLSTNAAGLHMAFKQLPGTGYMESVYRARFLINKLITNNEEVKRVELQIDVQTKHDFTQVTQQLNEAQSEANNLKVDLGLGRLVEGEFIQAQSPDKRVLPQAYKTELEKALEESRPDDLAKLRQMEQRVDDLEEQRDTLIEKIEESLNGEDNEGFDCSICQDDENFDDRIIGLCHNFHQKCLEGWFKRYPVELNWRNGSIILKPLSCPACRCEFFEGDAPVVEEDVDTLQTAVGQAMRYKNGLSQDQLQKLQKVGDFMRKINTPQLKVILVNVIAGIFDDVNSTEDLAEAIDTAYTMLAKATNFMYVTQLKADAIERSIGSINTD